MPYSADYTFLTKGGSAVFELPLGGSTLALNPRDAALISRLTGTPSAELLDYEEVGDGGLDGACCGLAGRRDGLRPRSTVCGRPRRPDKFPKDPRNTEFVKLQQVVKNGWIEGYIVETVVTLEAIRKFDRAKYFAGRIPIRRKRGICDRPKSAGKRHYRS